MSRFTCVTLAVVFSFVSSGKSPAQDTTVRIEEDWELRVSQPDEQLDAPQVSVTMIPFGSNPDLLLQLDLNHASTPSFSKGGIQVRVCTDDTCLAQTRLLDDQRLDQEMETINWTQVVQLASEGFYFGIGSGSSTSWGSFGGPSSFVYVSQANAGSSLSLNDYDPQLSCGNSGVTYASNRVTWLRLKKIRVYNAVGQVTEWTLNQDVQ